MSTIDNLIKALKKTYPNGHAFRLFRGLDFRLVNEGLLAEPNRIAAFNKKVRDSGIPGRLPSEALEDWEELFQLQENASLSDEERNGRIKARFNAVGGQGKDYLEDVLNQQFQLLLGDYIIYTATCGNPVITCGDPDATCGSFIDSDDTDEIVIYENVPPYTDPNLVLGTLIVKTDNDSRDLIPSDSTYWGSFWFISGSDGLGSWLELPANRESEFIETVLKYKPVDSWVIAQVNFV
jgi:hypothetical protein